MRAVERVADLDGDRERLLDRELGCPLQPLLERLAFEVFEHQIVEVAVAADVVDGADVGIVQRGNRPRFLLEALPRLGIGRQRSGKHLDGDDPIEPRVAGAVDFAHTARANRRHDFVRPNPRAGLERHATRIVPAMSCLVLVRGTGGRMRLLGRGFDRTRIPTTKGQHMKKILAALLTTTLLSTSSLIAADEGAAAAAPPQTLRASIDRAAAS